MPPAPDRTSRQANYNGIGDVGRITGVQPPKNVPRDSAGNEKASAFFAAATDDHTRSSIATSNAATTPGRKSTAGRGAPSPARLAASDKRKRRTDNFHELGEQGRITGRAPPQAKKDPITGFEDANDFFASSPSGSVAGSSAAKSMKKITAAALAAKNRKKSPPKQQQQQQEQQQEQDYRQYDDDQDFGQDYGGGGDDDDDEDDDEMGIGGADIDDASTPSAYRSRQAKASPSTSAANNPKLVALKRGANRPAQPSPLSKSRPIVRDDEDEEEGDNEEDDDEDEEEQVRQSMVGNSGGSSAATRKKAVRSKVPDADEESEEEEEVSPVTRRRGKNNTNGVNPRVNGNANGRSRDKGKGKAKTPPTPELDFDQPQQEQEHEYDYDQGPGQYDEDDEDDDGQGQGMEDIEEEDEDEDAQPRASSSRKTVTKAATAPQRKKPAAASAGANNRKRQREPTYDEDGVRRSARQRVEPLEYWRNERVIYKRRASGLGINAVVRIPRAPAEPLSKKHGKRSGSTPANAAAGSSGRRKVKDEVPEEDGVDDMTDPDGLVWSWEGRAETMRRIAFTAKMMDPRPTTGNKFMFQKIFTELDYLAGGILQIPAGAEKPTKAARDNSYMFYCIEGAVSVVVHRTRFSIGPGATFFVPRGNTYSITATSNRDVKLFFTQGRRVYEGEDGASRPDELEPEEEEEEEEEEGEQEAEEEEEEEEE